MSSRIVVGYDGSASSEAAAEWAAAEAAARGVELVILCCVATHSGERAGMADAQRVADESCSRHVGLTASARVAVGPPREVLVEASADAALVVVGKTGAGAVKSLILGSVANSVVRRSVCPTALIPAGSRDRPVTGRVVVGVDGSLASQAAVDWAVEAAAVRGGALVLVSAWSFHFDGPVTESAEARDATCARAAAALDEIVAATRVDAHGVDVHGKLVEDAASAALLDAGDGADLVVVGSRGRGGLRSMLFGSVAHAMTEQSTCPTVIIRRKNGH